MSSVEAEHRPPRRPPARVSGARHVIRYEQPVDVVDRAIDDGSYEVRVGGEAVLERGTDDPDAAANIEAGCEATGAV